MTDKTAYHIGNISIDADGRFYIHFASYDKSSHKVLPKVAYGGDIRTLSKVLANIQETKPFYLSQIEELGKREPTLNELSSQPDLLDG